MLVSWYRCISPGILSADDDEHRWGPDCSRSRCGQNTDNAAEDRSGPCTLLLRGEEVVSLHRRVVRDVANRIKKRGVNRTRSGATGYAEQSSETNPEEESSMPIRNAGIELTTRSHNLDSNRLQNVHRENVQIVHFCCKKSF